MFEVCLPFKKSSLYLAFILSICLFDSYRMNVYYVFFLVELSPANEDIVRLICFCMETKCKLVSLNGFACIIIQNRSYRLVLLWRFETRCERSNKTTCTERSPIKTNSDFVISTIRFLTKL